MRTFSVRFTAAFALAGAMVSSRPAHADEPAPPPPPPPSAQPPPAATAPPAASAAAPPAASYSPPPPGYGPPPPGYGPPPPGYAPPPPGYDALPPPKKRRPRGPPKTLPYEEGRPAPDGYHKGTRIRLPLVIAGASAAGGFYFASIFVALASRFLIGFAGPNGNNYLPLMIPVAGPFIGMRTIDPSPAGTFALAVLGGGQIAGIGLLISGFAARETRWIRNDISQVRWTIAPIAGRDRAGLNLVGAF